jgi:hypothetical protein
MRAALRLFPAPPQCILVSTSLFDPNCLRGSNFGSDTDQSDTAELVGIQRKLSMATPGPYPVCVVSLGSEMEGRLYKETRGRKRSASNSPLARQLRPAQARTWECGSCTTQSTIDAP